ncbi:chemotaxis protein CheA [Clostridium tagluense]|uniref:chemotaxis protein CheA n=1 Tax=Clostridium tagluense TaxID=360422 RepID=UPI001C0E1992|nr:chemotaxis protein CheA [Clostridium tagluense]MBU3126693.1 chemotaxis protein CheA [Clostridium tagluense]MCB2310052.1 chemotaxis protein CheA [Clostridium tagluense]MCB2314418.1 chemotaxis protein CheA [Clostridium tagluense]MCB2319264.1 chemotaxis protein CheA [Clostridium tagluense]MCB2324646.1 chemotaxis protein CheA [Clostridium tagluense]
MDTSQYMSMFLEESMENLQTLNEALLTLEQQPEDMDKLNEIFRVAHTIKGMAATMGFSQMAELTHKMEDVLSKFREGELKVTEKVVTVLFRCLDTLEKMVNNISEGISDKLEIEDIIDDLHSIAEKGGSVENQKKEIAVTGDSNDNGAGRITLNEYDVNVIKQAMERMYNAYEIKILLSENTLLKSARAFLIFKSLEEYGEIIKSIPGAEELENENFEFEINLIYITNKEKDEVIDNLANISEVEKVEVEDVDLENGKNNLADKSGEFKEIEQSSKAEKGETKVSATVETKAKEEDKNKDKKEAVVHKKAHQSVRVELDRLDKFMNMVSELVIHRTRLEQISSVHKLNDLNETLEQVARATSELQDLVMKIRMLPLEVVFNRFPRMIRDLSKDLGKEMDLQIQGQETELDRTVIDEIGEPLLHLLRNAADHGIESSEDRIAKGKNPIGVIKLIAYAEGTKAIIKVEDDGKGLAVDKIRAKANKVGINTEGMSDADIKNLIFAQGFSTNEEVTDISGRGVGMDVVKTKIAALGGTVDAISEIDKGTSFIIRLPLTLQIIQALLIKIGDETMAISLGYIDRVIDYNEELIKKTNNKEVIVYNDSVIPLVRVSKKLQIETSNKNKKYIVIVRVGEKIVGLLVDSLLGQQEIVIKPLGKTLQGLTEYIGATILGDGLVTLILDAAALV